MLASILIALAAGSLPVAAPATDPPIKVWLNNDGGFVRGDYPLVKFRTAEDGYVLLLHADADGRIRVLFPIDPTDDNFVRGQKTFEVGGRESEGTFYIDYAEGSGMVYAAWSRDPFKFGDFVRADHWDYRVFEQYRIQSDPESELTDLVLHMTEQGFDFGVARYTIYSRTDYSSESSESTTYVGLSFGWGYPSYWYDPYPYCCGFYYPVHYGYPYYPFYGGGYYPYYPYYPYHPTYPYYGYRPGYPGYPGYGYPGGNYRGPYTFKPGGTVFGQPTTYRPRTEFVNKSSIFEPAGRNSPTTSYRPRGTPAAATATASATRPSPGRRSAPSARSTQAQPVAGGHVEAGRRPVSPQPAPMPTYVRPQPRARTSAAGDVELPRSSEVRSPNPSNRATSSTRPSTATRGEPRTSRRPSSATREAPMPEYIRLSRPSDAARSGDGRVGLRGSPEYVRPSRGGSTTGGTDRPSARSPAPSRGPGTSAPSGRGPGYSAPSGRSPGASAPAARAPSAAPSSRGGYSGGGGGRGR